MAALLSPQDRLVTIPQGVPSLTLGWEVIQWAGNYLKHPNGPRSGQRWEFVESQVLFILHWYSVNEDGSWVYHHGVRRLSKGSGKSPFAGLLALAELCAPVRLKDFDPDLPGGCKGKPVDMPWVQIAATAESQTKNTMRMVRALAPKGSRIVQDFKLDPGKTVYYKEPEGLLETITSSAGAAEGAEASFDVEDEALVLGTMIPTPSGWTTVGEIKPGDVLFGSDGPVAVLYVTPVYVGRPCYRVTFQDGTSLVADEGHLWYTKLLSAAMPQVRSTRQMVEDGRRFMVPRMKPFDVPAVDLPLDPYVLGAWLGDGSSRWASLTVGAEDLDFMLGEMRSRGIPAAGVVKSGAGRAATVSLRGNRNGMTYTKDGSSVRGALCSLGVLNDKHIPDMLLRASLAQRLDLLRGLMDTDGSIDAKTGSAVFVGGRKKLVDGVVELVRSLGYVVSVRSRIDERWPSRPEIWKVAFRPDDDLNPFLMSRKASRVKPPSRRRWKTITSIEPVESRPVQCIRVDAPDHLFVAGDGWTLTHNTEHWLPGNGGPDLAATIEDNLAKSGNRSLETSNAWKPGIGSVAEATYDAWLAQEEGRTRGKGKILYDARIAPPDTDMASEASLRRSLEFTYGDCWWQKMDPIMARIWDPRSSPDDSKRKYLNWPTVAADAWTTPQDWALLSDPTVIVADGDEIGLFFDGSLSNDATALLGCHIETGHVFCIDVWEPQETQDGTRGHVPVDEVDAAVAHSFDRWNPVGFFGDVKEWESWTKVTWPERYADRLAIMSVPGGKDPQSIAWDMRSHVYDFTMAAELTLTEIGERAFTHDGDSRVARHVANARNHPNRWGVSVSKETRASPKKIDAAVCVIGARMVRRLYLASVAARAPEKKKPGRVFGFA
jgi:hypothetical protein